VLFTLPPLRALAARGMHEGFAAAISQARDRLLAGAAKISDPRWRARFLTSVPDNARTLALAGDKVRSVVTVKVTSL
jgi:eukaryotic-like serine/threonine-protein kinase